MNIARVLIELRAELEVLNAAITSLERLQHVAPRKRTADVRRAVRHAAGRDGARTVAGTHKAE
jgi:hypothetical protein